MTYLKGIFWYPDMLQCCTLFACTLMQFVYGMMGCKMDMPFKGGG